MKIGAVNNYNNDICEEIKLIASEGFDFVDLTLEPIFSGSLDVENVRKCIAETNLEIIGHTSPFLPVIFPLKSIRKASMEEYIKYVNFFSDIGVKIMNVHPSLSGTLMSPEDMLKYNKDFLSQLNKICKKKNISLMLENVLEPFNTPESFVKLLEGLNEVKVHLDIGHCYINTPRDLVREFFETFGERIIHIHFSDNCGIGDDHLPLGAGNIDWKKQVSILKEYNYDNTITLEIFSQDRKYLLRSKQYLEEIL